ncbi:MAG TPA: asparagine synthase-related protein [Allosphingosinicella sp.]|nr:asparagine synthase-related protein [Allosphingosinicella sp.]
MFAVIADPANGVFSSEIRACASGLSAPPHAGCLRTVPDVRSTQAAKVAAAVRVPGFLAEDRFDAQPLLSDDGTLLFAAQVRLDNRDELIRTLDLRRDPATTADSYILFAAYQRWSVGALDRVIGAFAFVAFDLRDSSLVAAVDAMSDYRLYYALRGRRILLCTQLAALAHFDRSSPDPLLAGLAAEARYLPGTTPFVGMHRLGGGETLHWSAERHEVRRWWVPAPSIRRFRDEGDYVAAAAEALDAAVARSLRSAVPVATTLSGGLDSGLVAASAARMLAERGAEITAYTSAPYPGMPVWQRPGWDSDDARFATATACLYGNIRHFVIRDEDRTALDLIPLLHERCATPVRNGANHLWVDRIHRAAAPGVVLHGSHGNFGISYSGAGANRELLLSLRWGAALRAALDAREATGRPVWRSLASGLLPERLSRFVQQTAWGEDLTVTRADFRKSHKQKLQRRHPPSNTRRGLRYFAMRWPHQWAVDPLAMWGTEVRDPTADRRLIELLISFPLHAFQRGGRHRGLAREIGCELLPDSIRLRRTRGMQAADYAVWVMRKSDAYRAAINRIERSPPCRQLLDIPALRRSLDRIEQGDPSTERTSALDRAVDSGLFLAERA